MRQSSKKLIAADNARHIGIAFAENGGRLRQIERACTRAGGSPERELSPFPEFVGKKSGYENEITGADAAGEWDAARSDFADRVRTGGRRGHDLAEAGFRMALEAGRHYAGGARKTASDQRSTLAPDTCDGGDDEGDQVNSAPGSLTFLVSRHLAVGTGIRHPDQELVVGARADHEIGRRFLRSSGGPGAIRPRGIDRAVARGRHGDPGDLTTRVGGAVLLRGYAELFRSGSLACVGVWRPGADHALGKAQNANVRGVGAGDGKARKGESDEKVKCASFDLLRRIAPDYKAALVSRPARRRPVAATSTI